MLDDSKMSAPRKLQDTEKITALQNKIIRTHFNLVGKRVSQDRLKELRKQYNKELPDIKKKYQEEQKKKEVRNIKKKVKDVFEVEAENYNDVWIFKQYLKDYSGNTQVIAIHDGKVIFELQINITKPYSKWWDNHYSIFMLDSDETLIHNHMKNENTHRLETNLRDLEELGTNVNLKDFYSRYYKKGKVKVIISQARELNANRVAQIYREGVENCMLLPIKKWIQEKHMSAQGESTKRRYKRYLKLIQEDMKTFETGVPEDKIQDIANKYQVDIHIDLPLQLNKYIECKSFKKPLRTFKFINTRLNHIDLNEVVCDEYEQVNREELDKIINVLDTNGTYYDYNKNMKNQIVKVRTLYSKYQVIDKYGVCANKFEEDTGLCDCKIDAIEDDKLYGFIREGTHANLTLDLCYDRDELKNIDMRKAFTNFWRYENYKGFVGKITDFRKCDRIMGIGYYRVESFAEMPEWLMKLNSYHIGNVYPSVEIEYLNSIGVKTKINEGCWGIDIDFRFSEEMYEKEDGVSFYSKWTGIQELFSPTKSFFMKGDKEYFENMKTYTDDVFIKYYESGEGLILYPKKHSYNLIHIAGFIKAYARLILYKQIEKMDFSKIVRIASDGIYFKEHNIELIEPFRYEDKEKFGNFGADSYLSGVNNKPDDDEHEQVFFTDPICDAENRPHFKRELFLGAGGNGKTHDNLEDKGFVRMLYVAPSWKLSTNKKIDYGVKNTVLARCLSNQHNRDLIRLYNVIVYDEVSQYSNQEKQIIFDTFDKHKLIFCGDLGFQLPPVEGEEMNTDGFDNIVEKKTNYRFKCDRQIEICKNVRKMIEEKCSKDKINKYICESYENVSRENMDYKNTDMILCSRINCGVKGHTNCNCDGKNYSKEWTDKYGKNKWVCDENTRDYNRGEIQLGEKPNGKWINRHGYTIHSVQGETYDETIFIDSRNLFDSRMGYTAISRARYWKQIKIII